MHHPSHEDEKSIVRLHIAGLDPADFARVGLQPLLSTENLLAMQQCVDTIKVHESIIDYVVRLVQATRTHRAVYLGASPRASVSLIAAARVRAAAEGRHFIVPDDIKSHAASVLRHRITLLPDAELEGVVADDVIAALLRDVSVPRTAAE